MNKYILGKKLGMSQVYGEDGNVIPVTVVEVEPNVVIQSKTKEKDGYEAVQVGTGTKRNITKPLKGHMKDLGKFKKLKEYRVKEESDKKQVGDKIDVSIFTPGDIVRITGVSKGKGFQGVVKRHGFRGMPASHGAHSVMRHAGSIGQRFPQHTLKGMRMAGRMGGVKSTVRGLRVISVDVENGLLAIKGAVPGNKGGLVIVQTQ